ncbi:hypothetical protein S1OALGB6SA_2064 [Olavius algarvensis spirochete endosymbiont]|uniref:rod-binding protein n=1 Tax=Olavius algarvensis spirochete endosymbiont TaxID=260710 RepID=UPI000F22E927|nr:rod-binding protein [Olavius algarvensis spirochete endosymbiont]CAD7844890.1 MAG: hypothetical protein [Olavius algarvensis spirochete endosymbiont]VDB00970.1 hypothetical protein S1OALGB6SA_2064 [Olavius algarvensis spirochete endosymbiont]
MDIGLLQSAGAIYEENRMAGRITSLNRRSNVDSQDELRALSGEFEALFVEVVLDSMRDTLNDDSLIPKNAGEKLFEDKLYDEYAEAVSKVANLGIAEMIYKQLSNYIPRGSVDIG